MRSIVLGRRLSVEAGAQGCPTEPAFRAESSARMPPRQDPSRRFVVRLGRTTEGFEATVDAVDATSDDGRVVASRTGKEPWRGETMPVMRVVRTVIASFFFVALTVATCGEVA